jgi:molybdopterin molybdotransferase
MSGKLLDDCFLHDGRRLAHAEAIDLLRQRVATVAGRRAIPLAEAAGCILATTAQARQPVPASTNAAVDGYAFAAADYDRSAGSELAVSARIAAGHALEGRLAPGTAVRIFTGAVLPAGLDTIVMQEDVEVAGGADMPRVRIPAGLKAGANVRQAGEDVKLGETLLGPGHLIRPQDLAGLASIGLGEVECFEPLSVAILSSGDEIVRAGSAVLAAGQVYDANAPMLAALVRSAGALAHDLGVLPDRPDAVRAGLADAAQHHHVILTSGGASRGEEDHMVAALDALGRRHLWQLAIKPGRPMSFGQIGDCVVVGLPGNPVAVFVCFLIYVWPMLRRLGGAPWPEPRRLKLPAAFEFTGRKPGRREFWRGMLVEGAAGFAVDKFRRDGSGLISGLRAADGLIDIPDAHGDVRRGDLVDFIPFTEFGILGQ